MSIKIKRCPTSVNNQSKEPTKEDYLISVAMHISDVQKGCAYVANKIIEAGINHDCTKISLIDDFMEDKAKAGADFKAGKWFQAHIEKERHHLSDRCPDDVTLIDVIEKLVDCTMAGTARKGFMTTDYISPEILEKAYNNTVEMLKNEICLEEE